MQSDNVTAKLVRRILLILLAGLPMVSEANQADTLQFFTRTISRKQYELHDHLGNVRAVVSDVKIPVNLSNAREGFKPTLLAATHYDPFGMELPDRSYSSEKYRYGFNGKEKDDEWKGAGNSYNFDARIYDPRIGRWLSVDPLADKFPHQSPYSFAFNNPISFVDPDGKEPKEKSRVKISPEVSKAAPFVEYVIKVMEKTSIYNSLLDVVVNKKAHWQFGGTPENKNNGFVNIGLGIKEGTYAFVSDEDIKHAYAKINITESGVKYLTNISYWYGNGDLRINVPDPTYLASTLYHETLHTLEPDGVIWEELGLGHELQATTWARNRHIAFLKEFDKERGVKHTDEQYNAMSWFGLEHTKAWDDLSDEEKEKIDKLNFNHGNWRTGVKIGHKKGKPVSKEEQEREKK